MNEKRCWICRRNLKEAVEDMSKYTDFEPKTSEETFYGVRAGHPNNELPICIVCKHIIEMILGEWIRNNEDICTIEDIKHLKIIIDGLEK